MAGAPSKSRRWRLLAAAVLVLIAGAGLASPAAAHTSLVSSSPGDGDIVERAPDQLLLTFATQVDPKSLRVELRRGDASRVGSLALADPDARESFELAADLPDLPPGPYVASWVSVGPDGHRASGEIAFGVGAVALADLRAAAAGGGGVDLLSWASGITRWGLAAALALAVGGLLATRWSQQHAGMTPLVDVVGRRSGHALHIGLFSCSALLAVRAGVVGWARSDLGQGTIGERAGDALVTPVVAALVVAAVVALATVELRRLRHRAGSLAVLDGVAAAALAAVALASAALGHAGASDEGIPVLVAAGLHGLMAAAWLGPLLVAGLVLRDSTWREAPPAQRAATMRAAGRAMAPVAAVSFAALVATGIGMTLVQGAWSELSATFQWTLAAKAALVVAVVLPLGALHDRRIGWTSRLRAARTVRPATRAPRRAPIDPALGRTLTIEAVALALVLAGGATLATANPLASSPAGSSALAAVDDPSSCEGLAAGRMSCYRRYLAAVLDDRGADDAAAELDRLAASVPEVGTDCHQLAHDLGNDAVAAFDGVAAALAEAPPTCWSGYFHGVVELAVARVGANPSGGDLHQVCESLGGPTAYSLPHYNCVHGLGHGVMLLTDHALLPALELCDRVDDSWERSSCLSGVFMERVISIQAAPERDDSNGDLLYPCSQVKEDHLDECYAMQSSYFLWKLDYDYASAFALCDQAPATAIETCYRSMGRDIASLTRHDPTGVAEQCALGSPTYFADCVEAAALDAALDAVDVAAADPVCAVLPSPDKESCQYAAAAAVGVSAESK